MPAPIVPGSQTPARRLRASVEVAPVRRPRKHAEKALIALLDALDARYHRINGPQV